MVGGDDQTTADSGMLSPGTPVAKVEKKKGRHKNPGEQIQGPIDAVDAGVVVVSLESLFVHEERYTGAGRWLPGARHQALELPPVWWAWGKRQLRAH